MWYSHMGTRQIQLFVLIAIKIKAITPGAHTFPETVLARHSKAAHATDLFYGFAMNVLVGACLVLGGSQFVAAQSDVDNLCGVLPHPLGGSSLHDNRRAAEYVHRRLHGHHYSVHRHLRFWIQHLQHPPCHRLAEQVLRLTDLGLGGYAYSRNLRGQLSDF